MTLTRRLVSHTATAMRSLSRNVRLSGLAAWVSKWKVWDWLLSRNGVRSLPPRRVRLELQVLEDRIAPSVTAIDDSYSTAYAQTLTVQASGVLTNDEGTNLTAAIVSAPAHGSAAIAPDGGLIYT